MLQSFCSGQTYSAGAWQLSWLLVCSSTKVAQCHIGLIPGNCIAIAWVSFAIHGRFVLEQGNEPYLLLICREGVSKLQVSSADVAFLPLFLGFWLWPGWSRAAGSSTHPAEVALEAWPWLLLTSTFFLACFLACLTCLVLALKDIGGLSLAWHNGKRNLRSNSRDAWPGFLQQSMEELFLVTTDTVYILCIQTESNCRRIVSTLPPNHVEIKKNSGQFCLSCKR